MRTDLFCKGVAHLLVQGHQLYSYSAPDVQLRALRYSQGMQLGFQCMQPQGKLGNISSVQAINAISSQNTLLKGDLRFLQSLELRTLSGMHCPIRCQKTRRRLLSLG